MDDMDRAVLEVHGEWPQLAGSRCDAVIAEQYWHDGELSEPANVIWLRADSAWHRLVIDCGVVFWRSADVGPEAYGMSGLGGAVRLEDVGRELDLAGEIIDGITGVAVPGGADVWIGFRSGRRITFRNRDDHTTYQTGWTRREGCSRRLGERVEDVSRWLSLDHEGKRLA